MRIGMPAAAALLAVVVCAGAYGFNQAELREATRQLAETRARTELLRPMTAKMLQADAKVAALDRRETVLIALTRDRLSFYSVLTGLTDKAPPGLRLTGLAVDGRLLTIGGAAANGSDLALFVRRLQEDRLLAEPAPLNDGQAALPAGQFLVTAKLRER